MPRKALPTLTGGLAYTADVKFIGTLQQALCGAALTLALPAGTARAHVETLFELSLVELMQFKVESATRLPQSLAKTPAAVHVIRQSDMRRAGVTSLLEALRLAPGVHVARIHASAFAISIRGMNSQYANKLLVMVDGRSVYSPVFAGVHWRLQDIPLGEIDRIEVIRGPGGSTWGPNAVNGIINIVTLPATARHGSDVTARTGTEIPADLYGSTSGTLEGGAAYRLYGAHKRYDDSKSSSPGGGRDDWHHQQLGWRVDTALGAGSALQIQGRLMNGRINETVATVAVAGGVPVPALQRQRDGRIADQYLQLTYTRPLAEGEEVVASAHVSSTRDSSALDAGGMRLRTAHGELTHALPLGPDRRMIWGGSATHNDVHLRGRPQFFSLRDAHHTLNYYSVFAQGEQVFLDDALQFTAGLKLERRPFAGLNWLPSLRALWAPDDTQVAWGAVSRAVRTPTLADRAMTHFNAAVAPGPTLVQARADERVREVDSEIALTTELGYRFQWDERVSADVSLFYTDYENYVSGEPGALECGPSGNRVDFAGPTGAGSVAGCAAAGDTYYVQPVLSDNQLSASTWGGEASVNWDPRANLRLSLHYSHYRESFRAEPGGSGIPAGGEQGTTPRHLAGLRASYDLSHDTRADGWLRHVGRLDGTGVDSYTELDLRLAHALTADCELSITGRNLLDAQHPEFLQPVSGTPPTEVERSISVGLSWIF